MEKTGNCCFCREKYTNYGNDIRPLVTSVGNRCCNACNAIIVIPNRLKLWGAEYCYGIRDTHTKCFITKDKQISDNDFWTDEIIKFKDLSEAEYFIKNEGLNICEPVRMLIREDN